MASKFKLVAVIAVWSLSACGVKTSQTKNSSDSDTIKDSVMKKMEVSDIVDISGPIIKQTDRTILLTAENGNAIGPNIKYMPEWRAFGWFTAADMVEWEVLVSHSGEYEVYLEWSVSNEEAGKEFLLKAGDHQLIGIVKKSGSWEIYKYENIGRISLSEGHQKITFKSKTRFEEGALLDFRQIKLVAIK